MYPIVLLCYRGDGRRYLKHVRKRNEDGVDGAAPLDPEAVGSPGGEVAGVEVDGGAVECEGEVVGSGVPGWGGDSGDGEGVGAEADAEGLYPGEVEAAARGAEADETGVDLEVRVGDERKVAAGVAVEVEDGAVGPDEPGVLAAGALVVTIGRTSCMHACSRMVSLLYILDIYRK